MRGLKVSGQKAAASPCHKWFLASYGPQIAVTASDHLGGAVCAL